MKQPVAILTAVLGVVVVGVGVMFVADLCPPDGPWPMPPWCDAAEAAAIADGAPDEGVASDPEPDAALSDDAAVALGITGLLDNLDGIQGHYSEAIVGISHAGAGEVGVSARAEADSGELVEALFSDETRAAITGIAFAFQPSGPFNIPSGFTGPVGPTGAIGAPAGACGAGAAAEASFHTQGTETSPPKTITSGLLEELAIENIDFDVLTGQGDNEPLEQMINDLITPGDRRLASPDGWNELVWEPLAELQEPADSLMDYHLWSVADDIEGLIVDDMRDTMVNRGIPPMVIDAFDASDNTGWFTNTPAEPEDRLAGMDIEAEFSGDLEGTITETRDFSIPVPGEMPVFSPLVGGGAVTFLHPTLGPIDFEVDLEWSGWDELGRVNVGTAHFVNDELGYEILMTFAEDGSKTGDVLKDGVVVGAVDLSTADGETYLDMTG